MLKLMGLFSLLVSGSYASNCYDGEFKINAITLKDGEREKSLLDVVKARKRTFNTTNAAGCPGKQDCFAYSVSATFFAVKTGYNMESKSTDGQVTTGTLDILTQTCLASSTIVQENRRNSSFCDGWKDRIVELLKDLNILVSDLDTFM